MAGWDKFWRESSADASFVGANGTHPLLVRHWKEFFSSHQKLSADSKCIDLASGTGIVVQSAQESPDHTMPLYCGLDLSLSAINQLVTHHPGTAGVVANAASAPFDCRSFDLVTSQFGVEYAGIAGIREAARLVAAGGDLVLVLHSKPGVVHTECSSSVEVIDKLRQARFFPLAISMFNSSFAAMRGSEQHKYERARRRFKPACRVLERALSKHGPDVASGFLQKLRNDIGHINAQIQNFEQKEVLGWLRQLDNEMSAYRARMKSMTDSSLTARELNEIVLMLSEAGLTQIESAALIEQESGTQLGWSLRARRD